MNLGQKVWIVFTSVNKHMRSNCSACEGQGKVQTIITLQERECAKCEGTGYVGVGNSCDYFVEKAQVVGISPKNRWLESYVNGNGTIQTSRAEYYLKFEFNIELHNYWYMKEEIFTRKHEAERVLEVLKEKAYASERDTNPDKIIVYEHSSYQRMGRNEIERLRERLNPTEG